MKKLIPLIFIILASACGKEKGQAVIGGEHSLTVTSSSHSYTLNSGEIEISVPDDFVKVNGDDVKKRFYKGNPPDLVFEKLKYGITITLKASSKVPEEVGVEELGEFVFDSVKERKNFLLLNRGVGDIKLGSGNFYSITFTDSSDNDLKMFRKVNVYFHNRHIFFIGYSVPLRYKNDFEAILDEAVNSVVLKQ